jgi:hypothetical protein
MTPLDLADIHRRIDTQRPLHWDVAARLVREVETLRQQNEALRSALASSVAAPSDGERCDHPFAPAPSARPLTSDDSARAGEPVTEVANG